MSEEDQSSPSNVKACAACRHQRRRCHSDCILAHYFPVERAAQFQAVHRLFGVHNLLKFYNAAPTERRGDVISSLTFEAEARRDHPVLGCVGALYHLITEIDATLRELEATSSLLAFYRLQRQEQQQQIQMKQLVLPARQEQQQQMMMMMITPPPEPMHELHPLQQLLLLPPLLPPPVLMNLEDREVDVGRMVDESSGNPHGSRPSDGEDIRSFSLAAPPPIPVVDMRSHMPGSSNPGGDDELVRLPPDSDLSYDMLSQMVVQRNFEKKNFSI